MSPKTTKKKAVYTAKKRSKAWPLLGLTLAVCVMLAGLAFVSVEMTALAIGFIALFSFIFLDNRQRGFWEKAMSFKMKKAEESQEELAQTVARTGDAIAVIKDNMAELSARVDAQETRINQTSEAAPVAARPTMPEMPPLPLRMEADNPLMPRAARPLTKMTDEKIPRPIETLNEEDEQMYTDAVLKELLYHAIRNQRVDVFLQPIVRLPQRKTRYYEMFARIRAKPGIYLPAGQYMKTARQEELMNDIDTLLLMHCLRVLKKTAHIERAIPFFLNITTETLKNLTFMRQLLAFLSKNRELSPRLVFEIRQRDYEDMHPAVLEIIRGLGKLGCAFSIDHVEEMKFDIKLLQVLKVRFVKINAARFIDAAENEREITALWKTKNQLESNGLSVIVEKIEDEKMLKDLLDYSVNYGQGYLFGRPNPEGAYRQRRAA